MGKRGVAAELIDYFTFFVVSWLLCGRKRKNLENASDLRKGKVRTQRGRWSEPAARADAKLAYFSGLLQVLRGRFMLVTCGFMVFDYCRKVVFSALCSLVGLGRVVSLRRTCPRKSEHD